MIVSDLGDFFRKRLSFIDKVEAYYKFKKDYIKLEIFDNAFTLVAWECMSHIYQNIEYVTNECKKLAKQLKIYE